MSMLDVAKFLSYSKSVDMPVGQNRYFNLSMANSGRLFCCLYGDRTHWCFGREQGEPLKYPTLSKGN